MKRKVAKEGFFWREKLPGGNPVTVSLQRLKVHGECVRFGVTAKGYGEKAVYIGGYFVERLVAFFYRDIVGAWQNKEVIVGEVILRRMQEEIESTLSELKGYLDGQGMEGRVAFRGMLLVGDIFFAFEKGEGAFLFAEDEKMYPVRLDLCGRKECFGMGTGELYEDAVIFGVDKVLEQPSGNVEMWYEKEMCECIYLSR